MIAAKSLRYSVGREVGLNWARLTTRIARRRDDMSRFNTLAIATMSLLVVGAALFAGGIGSAQQQAEADKVKATLDAFHAALSALDIRKMEEVWAHDGDVIYIGPRDKVITVGWDAVKNKWEATLGFWAELKVTTQGDLHLHVNGGNAWSDSIADVVGKPKTGAPVNGPTFESIVLEKRRDRWLIVSNSTSRVPQ
jgi:ketosteroid isomerase-like protein